MGRPKKPDAATAKVDARVTPAERAALDQLLAALRSRGNKAGDSTSEWIRSHIETDCAALGIRIDRPLLSLPFTLDFVTTEHTGALETTPAIDDAEPVRPSERAPAAPPMDVAPKAPAARTDTGELLALIADLSARLSALEARPTTAPIAVAPMLEAPEPAPQTPATDVAPSAEPDVAPEPAQLDTEPAADVAPSAEPDVAPEPSPAAKPAALDTAHEKPSRSKASTKARAASTKPKASTKPSTSRGTASTTPKASTKPSTSKPSTSKPSTSRTTKGAASTTPKAATKGAASTTSKGARR